ncbi:MAG: AsmA family protein [Terracidiphilus sp.]|nr:AsmA family protein [Terracidiphilus sp.]MDR3775255.1 AsmA family protein [Terracidiphilus sp.]
MKHKRLWQALAVLVAILAVVIVPPLVSLSHYKSQITRLMAASLGRPVRLSAVEMRLLPRPAFVLSDLTVEEDPVYGAEPVLHANTVTANIRLLSLWRGRLVIGSVSLDEASLNLVRTPTGRWNLDALFRTPAVAEGADSARQGRPLPYIEGTNSRINIKNGAEKLPFSLVDTKFSFWQEKPGDWRIQLRGQPARTDVSINLADTGIVRMDASIRKASQMRQMPVHLDLDWREAHLGQLTRLILGSDPGWRGDVTGEVHLDGTAEAAQVKTRLRATGVHRQEFAPASPLDFDARCSFDYHHSVRSVENLLCDSPLGDGHIRLAGGLPGEGAKPHLSIELDKIPVAAGLDALRTVRSDFGPGLEAKGTVSGKIAYAASTPENGASEAGKQDNPSATGKPGSVKAGSTHSVKAHAAEQGPLTGSFTVEGFQLSGDGLSSPILIPKVVLEPVTSQGTDQGANQPAALTATVNLPAGGAVPLTVATRLALSGYQLTVHGQASIVRAREFAHVAGMADAAALDALAGDAATVDLNAEGPWLAVQKIHLSSNLPAAAATEPAAPAAPADVAGDRLSGTVTLRNANWKADYLVNHVEIAQATLHLDNSANRWDPVVFSYGPVKGTATLELPRDCAEPQPCLPKFQVQLGALDSSVLQAAILGAHERGTLLSTLLAKLRPAASAPTWPQMEGTVKADSLILGPVTLHDATASLRMLPSGVEITGLDAALLGGRVHGTGSLRTPATDKDKPAYSLEGQFLNLSPQAVGQLVGQHWSGGTFEANGKADLVGYMEADLMASAKGAVHFEWKHGIAGAQAPAPLARFDRWTADAEIANGAVTLKQNEVQRGAKKASVEAALTFSTLPKVVFPALKDAKK